MGGPLGDDLEADTLGEAYFVKLREEKSAAGEILINGGNERDPARLADPIFAEPPVSKP